MLADNSIATTPILATNATANNPTTWNTPIIIGAISAIMAVIVGVPGAILAVKKIQGRKRKRARQGDAEDGVHLEVDVPAR
ncbi:uncharacterized protein N0V89_006693 [Didymosphaeria variabile]|uniref:Uncharacterized protein n=1 Tax=Didymosphaeria variabile TaxID=1932322 RepID=A0A9W9C9J4_9PLEO|nr:uncharacterized protein N0V89_006693 [Didymosphaeria variabile]KAJ4351353.1 hypothetical protein N0V89_006693 [Didymosphaeria variabile]